MKHFLFFMGLLCLSPLFGQLQYYKKEIGVINEQGAVTGHLLTYDGGFLFFSQTQDLSSGNKFITLTKTDYWCTIQWKKRFGPEDCVFGNAVQCSDSGYFFCYRLVNQSSDYTAIKVDKNGNTIFTKTISTTGGMALSDTPVSFAKNNGNCYVAGTIFDPVLSYSAFHVYELDAAGNVSWSQSFNSDLAKSRFIDLDTCPNGDLVLLGYCHPASLFIPIITRISSTGTFYWSRAYAGLNKNISPTQIEVSPTGQLFVTGSTSSGFQQAELFVMKTDGNGVLDWSVLFHNYQKAFSCRDMLTMQNRDVALLINFYSSSYFMRIDSTGVITCTRYYLAQGLTNIDTTGYGQFSFTGNNNYSRPIVMLADQCGNSCDDTSFAVTKTGLPISVDTLTGTQIIPLNVSAAVKPTVPVSIEPTDVCMVTSVPEMNGGFLTLSPNPARESITISSDEVMRSVNLFNSTGQVVMVQKINSQSSQLPLTLFPPGIYLLSIEFETHVEFRRLIIQ